MASDATVPGVRLWTVQRLADALAEHVAAGRGDDLVYLAITPPKPKNREGDWWNRRDIAVDGASWSDDDDAFFCVDGVAL